MWTKEKINQFITDGIEENIHLDYKGAGSISKNSEKKKEISKDISAFANSDGGTIIYGIREFDDVTKNHLPEKVEAIDGKEFTKEWLEQIINSTISPRIEGVIITPIQYGEKEENKVIYVVDIPKGNTAHQAQDKRYYKRYNFQSIMMEDWEIKDIINRQTKTNIQIEFKPVIEKNVIKNLIKKHSNTTLEFDIWANNKGTKVVKYIDCFISGDSKTAKQIIKPFVNKNGFEKLFSNEYERKLTIGDDEFVIYVDRIAILPNTSRKIGSIKIKTDFIINHCKLGIQVSTEDNTKTYVLTGKEIIE